MGSNQHDAVAKGRLLPFPVIHGSLSVGPEYTLCLTFTLKNGPNFVQYFHLEPFYKQPISNRRRFSKQKPARKPASTSGTPGRNRTYNLRIRSPALYPLSYWGKLKFTLLAAV